MKVLTVLMLVLAVGEPLSLAFLLKSLALSHSSKGASSHHKAPKTEEDHHSETSGHGKQFAIRIAGEHVKSVLIKISGDDVKLARTKDGYIIGIGNEKPKASIKIELPDEDLHYSLPYPPSKDYPDDDIPHHFPGPYKIHEDIHEEHDQDGPPKKPDHVYHVHREPAHHDGPPDSHKEEHHFPSYYYHHKGSKHSPKKPDHAYHVHEAPAHHDAPPDSHKEEHFPPYDYHHKGSEHPPKESTSHNSLPNIQHFESFLKLWQSLQYPAEKRIGNSTENGTTPSPPPQKRQTRQRRLY